MSNKVSDRNNNAKVLELIPMMGLPPCSWIPPLGLHEATQVMVMRRDVALCHCQFICGGIGNDKEGARLITKALPYLLEV